MSLISGGGFTCERRPEDPDDLWELTKAAGRQVAGDAWASACGLKEALKERTSILPTTLTHRTSDAAVA